MKLGLDKKTILVVDKNYQPRTIISPRRAIGLLMSGNAKVITNNFATYSIDEWMEISKSSNDIRPFRVILRSKSHKLIVPYVIYLLKVLPRKDYTLRFTRKNIYVRDEYTCCYCGKKLHQKNITLDHIVPRCRGGKSTWKNVVSSCLKCNQSKGSSTLNELGWSLLKEPTRPSYYTFSAEDFERSDYWKPFIG